MESDLHKELKNIAINYLWNKNYRIAKLEKTAGYYGIYDAWGISYTTYYTIGIEVKVSRADFLKSHRYKEYKLSNQIFRLAGGNLMQSWGGTNENYYLCPKGLIQPEETGVYGLLWWNGRRLVNKKKPAFIKIHIKDKLDQLIELLEGKRGSNII